MKKQKKWRFNKDKAFKNFVILVTVIATGILIYKIATNGISFISTIGYFN